MIYFGALGGVKPTMLTADNDLDNIMTHGIMYQTNGTDNPANVPESGCYNNLIWAFEQAGSRYVQILFSLNLRRFFYRVKMGTTSPWFGWEQFQTTT